MTVNLEEWQSCGYKKATCIGVPFWCFFQHQVCNLKSRNAIYCHTFTTGRCFQSKWSLLNVEILKKIPKTNIIFSLWIISSSVSKKSSPDISKEKIRIIDYHLWLVVYLPLWKKIELVSWDYDIPNIWKNNPNGSFHQWGYPAGWFIGWKILIDTHPQIPRFSNARPSWRPCPSNGPCHHRATRRPVQSVRSYDLVMKPKWLEFFDDMAYCYMIVIIHNKLLIWYDMIWFDMIWNDMIWYEYDMIWYDM